MTRNHTQCDSLRAMGVVPLAGDLDNRKGLSRIAGLADIVLHFAPPPNAGTKDVRTRHLLAALSRGTLPRQFIYISTSGVYGDCRGARVNETHTLNPQSARAQRRVDAETQIRAWARENGVRASILRVPGIYAEDRLPLERLQAGMPAIRAEEDSYTNHIHADDLARIVVSALRRAQRQPRVSRQRRRRDEDGRLLRRRRRCIPICRTRRVFPAPKRNDHCPNRCCRS